MLVYGGLQAFCILVSMTKDTKQFRLQVHCRIGWCHKILEWILCQSHFLRNPQTQFVIWDSKNLAVEALAYWFPQVYFWIFVMLKYERETWLKLIEKWCVAKLLFQQTGPEFIFSKGSVLILNVNSTATGHQGIWLKRAMFSTLPFFCKLAKMQSIVKLSIMHVLHVYPNQVFHWAHLNNLSRGKVLCYKLSMPHLTFVFCLSSSIWNTFCFFTANGSHSEQIKNVQQPYILALRDYCEANSQPHRCEEVLSQLKELQTCTMLLLQSKLLYMPYLLNAIAGSSVEPPKIWRKSSVQGQSFINACKTLGGYTIDYGRQTTESIQVCPGGSYLLGEVYHLSVLLPTCPPTILASQPLMNAL